MKYIILFLIIFFSPNHTFCQADIAEYKFGTPCSGINAPLWTGRYSNDDLGISVRYEVYNKGYYNNIIFQSFNTSKMHEIKRREILFPKEWRLAPSFFWLEETLYCFYLTEDPQNKLALYCKEFDYNTCELIGKGKKILNVNNIIYNQQLHKPFKFVLSKDKSKLLIYALEGISKAKVALNTNPINQTNLVLCVLDKDLNKLASNTIRMPYPENKIDRKSFFIDTKGTPYMLSAVYPNRTDLEPYYEIGKLDPNYQIKLYKFDVEGKKYTTQKISQGKQLIRDVKLFSGEGEAPIIGGYYYLRNETDNIRGNFNLNGLCLFHFNEENASYKRSDYSIPNDILHQYTPSYNKKTGFIDNKELDRLRIHKYLIQKDKSIIVIGETIDFLQQTSGNILVTKINSEGGLQWMKKLPKRLEGIPIEMDQVAGFNHLETKNYQYFIFNEKDDNEKLRLNKLPKEHAMGDRGLICAFQVNNETGEVKREIIFDMNKVNGLKLYYHSPYKCMRTFNNELILEFRKVKKEDIMVKLKFVE